MDHFQRSANNTFANLQLDRHAEQRDDNEWLDKQLYSPDARCIYIHNGRCQVNEDQSRLHSTELPEPETATDPQQLTLLGSSDQHVWFSNRSESPEQSGQWLSLRSAAAHLPARQAGLAAYAIALDNWQQGHQYCGQCGHRNAIISCGHRMHCSHCQSLCFPRTDPAMIVMVTYQDQCLLGRQPNWPAKRYSALAGFVEPGETLEDTVRREVMEEAGVSLADIHYQSSQPWPFPASIMLGYTATAISPDIRLGDELEDARWWSASQLAADVSSGELILPYQLSISWQLLANWYLQQTGDALESLAISHAHRTTG